MTHRYFPVLFSLAVLICVALAWWFHSPAASRQRRNAALQDAIWHNDTRGVLSALAQGADPNALLPLTSMGEQRRPLASRLRERLPGGHVPPPDVWTPLTMAIAWEGQRPDGSFGGMPENPVVVRALLDTGADARATLPEFPMPVLAAAAIEGRDATVRLLLAHGADPNARIDTGSGWTPLMEAAAEGKVAVVRTLLNAGADVNAWSADGTTALRVAISVPPSWPQFQPNDGLATIRLLLAHHAAVGFRNRAGDSALTVARRLWKRRRRDAAYFSQVVALLTARTSNGPRENRPHPRRPAVQWQEYETQAGPARDLQ